MLLVLAVGKCRDTFPYVHVSSLQYFASASGFTTRSDIGPAREGPSAEVVAYVT